jgi:lipoprotein LpqH
MKREAMITAGAAAILGVALAGCSHSGANRTGNGAVAATSESNTKVVVDGKDQTVKGSVACTTAAGNVSIAIGGATAGASGAPTGIGAVLTDANPPVVKSVALGNVNGVTLGVGGTSGNANATKDGSSYKISGTASGADMSNPMAGPVSKSFEIDVTCP